MRFRFILLVLPVAVAVAVASVAFAGGQDELAQVRNATAAFHDLQAAKNAGYTVELQDVNQKSCIANLATPNAGAMGVHMVNPVLLNAPAFDDVELDPKAPEVLVYEPRNDGTLKLVAVEYVVFQGPWHQANGTAKPKLFGVTFDENDGTRYGLPPFYALHAWIWKPNPTPLSGIFSAWNPRVSCPTS